MCVGEKLLQHRMCLQTGFLALYRQVMDVRWEDPVNGSVVMRANPILHTIVRPDGT
jgi:hypothetical protein